MVVSSTDEKGNAAERLNYRWILSDRRKVLEVAAVLQTVYRHWPAPDSKEKRLSLLVMAYALLDCGAFSPRSPLWHHWVAFLFDFWEIQSIYHERLTVGDKRRRLSEANRRKLDPRLRLWLEKRYRFGVAAPDSTLLHRQLLQLWRELESFPLPLPLRPKPADCGVRQGLCCSPSGEHR